MYGVCVVGWMCRWGCMGIWFGRGVVVGMGILHLMRVMIISYFMTVICVGREGVVAIFIF